MGLKKLSSKNRKEIAKLLVNYWKERGFTQYNEKWAGKYLLEGHKKEIKKMNFLFMKKMAK